MAMPPDTWISTDFNGFLERNLLCLSHSETAQDASGRTVTLHEGMILTAFDLDADDNGNPDRILVTGTVERSPAYAQCRGSIWSLRVDSQGVQWESQLTGSSPDSSLERTRGG
jgi:hypothetical protein